VASPPLAGRPAQVAAEAADPDHPLERRPLAGSPLDWYADLYFTAARHHHWTATQVDALEVWEMWSALGHALSENEWLRLTEPEDRGRGRRGRRSRSGGDALPSGGRDLVAERVAYSQGRGPKPEVDDRPDPRLAQVIRLAPGAADGTT